MNLIPIEESDLREQFVADIEDVKQYWIDCLSDKPTAYNEGDLADWLEETGWLENDFQQAFNALKKDRQIENLDDTTNRRKKWFIHFDKNERLRRCV